MREHTITQAGKLHLVPATVQSPGTNEVSIEIAGDYRVIRANGIPDHQTGRFPNRGNPNRIAEQSYSYRVPAKPEIAQRVTPAAGQSFGIAVNGIPFDPGAAEVYRGNPRGGWHYEPLSGAVPLGIDANHAHVQPTGAYHYHGLPVDLLKVLKVDGSSHSSIVGWAADGFPIYAIYGFANPDDNKSQVKGLKSSYRLKEGTRPGGNLPDGKYDGTFVADYVFEEGLGDLDECNGRVCITPEYPEGTYAYFLTEDWPVIPRNYRGTPSPDFRRGGRPPRHSPPR
ncbi:YHYH protein [Bythopirellula polymerisocia]|uniref:YHYH domain-containing protein n=1 Tax=Bythopirellula polymerisocia TaxID=2528003 RepID=A0A5C6D2F6_9BACT|nr:YHYH protein [Bythopirellula polymerisocia]TWU30034.1 hypothetical protein Pla144_08200 [Bythopirellula polymerisocia]